MTISSFLKNNRNCKASSIWLAGFACALAIWAGFPNDLFVFPPAVFFWPLCLAIAGIICNRPKQAFICGWFATFAGMAAALYWLSFPVRHVGGLPWPGAFACAFLICAILALQGGVFCLAAYILRNISPWRQAIAFCLLWYLLEYSFAIAFGFPWLPLAGALPPWPFLIQAADVFGSYFLGSAWLFCFIASFLALPVSGARVFRPGLLATGICAACALGGYGFWKLSECPMTALKVGAGEVNVLFVEGNIDQNQKWLPVFQRKTLELYINLTAEGLEGAAREGIVHPLVLWPETALPFFFERNPELARATSQCAINAGCPLLFGAPGIGKKTGLPEDAVFNRAFLLGPNGNVLGYYDKEHLVPFGEYLPEWLNFSFLEALLQGVGIYQEGSDTKPLRYGPLALGMLICYEGIFPWLAQARVEDGANILVDISNDGWFGHSPASRQHLYLTVLRCVEQNRWLLRATNTGISAIADSRGRLALAGPQFRAGWLAGRARLEKDFTVYHKYGQWLPVLAVIFFIVCCLQCKKGKF